MALPRAHLLPAPGAAILRAFRIGPGHEPGRRNDNRNDNKEDAAMTFLKKLGPDAKVYDGFQTWPDVYGPWTEVCQRILRDSPSKLTAGERELIGTFVSRLNECEYCYKVHNSAVEAYGMVGDLVEKLRLDIDAAPVDAKLRPILRYVRKLTLTQHKMVQADADAVYAAGWDEDDLHIAIAITALFNFMNRFVHGLGIQEDPAYTFASGARIKAMGYTGSNKLSKDQRDKFATPGKAAE